MSALWSDFVHELEPYVPGEQPQASAELVKLNTNENPYGPSPRVLEALAGSLTEALRLYPDPASVQLRTAIGKRFDVPVDQVFVGNGSDEVLAHAFHGLFRHPRPLLFPSITYSFYPVYCGLYGIEYQCIPLNAAFEIDIADYDRPSGGIVIANPNAPTGLLLELPAIAELARRNPDSVVLIDEAYIDFGGDTAATLVGQFPNLLVVQTFSKSRSLAGLRVGFALGQRHLIEALERVKNSFNSYPVDTLAQVGALAALEDEAYFAEIRARVIDARQELAMALMVLGFDVLPSAANFLFARHATWDAGELYLHLRQRNIIVRHFSSPDIAQFLRISVGTDEQHAALLQALRGIIRT